MSIIYTNTVQTPIMMFTRQLFLLHTMCSSCFSSHVTMDEFTKQVTSAIKSTMHVDQWETSTNKNYTQGVPVLEISDPNPIFQIAPTHYVILRIIMIFTITF